LKKIEIRQKVIAKQCAKLFIFKQDSAEIK